MLMDKNEEEERRLSRRRELLQVYDEQMEQIRNQKNDLESNWDEIGFALQQTRSLMTEIGVLSEGTSSICANGALVEVEHAFVGIESSFQDSISALDQLKREITDHYEKGLTDHGNEE